MAELSTYRGMRDPGRTPEPVPAEGPLPRGNDDTFVIQEHHATALHWDFRLERDGVLVSWAVPKGLPPVPKENHLAVHTEDHPMDYAAFHGHIPDGEYGGGDVIAWDRGTYECEKWTDREVKVVLHGSRVEGRYVLFNTRGKDWMIRRMSPPSDPSYENLPDDVDPMLPTCRTRLPAGDDWSVEFGWGGQRALASVAGGRLRLAGDVDLTKRFPELRELGESLGARRVLLDGELVGLRRDGAPDPARLARRAEATASQLRRLRTDEPVVYVAYDLLHDDGHSLLATPYADRRAVLDGMKAPGLLVAPVFGAEDKAAVRTAARERGLPSVRARRLSAPYTAGRSADWIEVRL